MVASESLFAFIGGIGMPEMVIFGIIAVLLFGSRLPSVARSLGKSIVEFKKGMNDLQDEVKSSIYSEPPKQPRVGYREERSENEPAAPKFEPPKSESEESKAVGSSV
jgi:sec-independent protein translocase protein TatA